MENDRYSEDIVTTIDTFRKIDLDKILEQAKEAECYYYHSVMSSKSQELLDSGQYEESKILWLLSNACSMVLNPESPNAPFTPYFRGEGRRSCLPEDFSSADISFFESILPYIKNFHLRARIADLCWFQGSNRNPDMALMAIDAYMEYKFEDEDRVHYCQNPYIRAIFLCSIHNGLAKDRLDRIYQYLIETLRKNIANASVISIISDLLLRIGVVNDTDEVYQILIETSNAARFVQKRNLLENALNLIHCKKKPDDRLYDVYSKLAEAYIDEASCASSGMFSADLYHKAILEYQKIPKKIRTKYVSSGRIKELNDLKEAANKQATNEMSLISSPPINLIDYVSFCRDHVRGRPFPEVMFAFVSLVDSQSPIKYREEAQKILQNSILLALVSRTHYSKDGRVVAKSPGVNLSDASDPANEFAVWEQMMSNYHMHVSLTVSGAIFPALKIINAEHKITYQSLIELCRISAAVFDDRVLIWAKGLYAGFENDFMVAVHMLTPQIEHYVRMKLKQNGVKTTTTDQSGIETENGLSTLLGNDAITNVLDENTVFELKAIFTESLGFNLRNDIAHGLVDSNVGYTYPAVYAWFFCLKLVLSEIMIQSENV